MAANDMTEARHRLERQLGWLLRAGVTLAASVVIFGGILYLGGHRAERPAYHTFHGEPAVLRRLDTIFAEALRLRGEGVIQLGLVLLIATPIARVAFSVYSFLHRRDWLYAGISAFVLALLLFGLLSNA